MSSRMGEDKPARESFRDDRLRAQAGRLRCAGYTKSMLHSRKGTQTPPRSRPKIRRCNQPRLSAPHWQAATERFRSRRRISFVAQPPEASRDCRIHHMGIPSSAGGGLPPPPPIETSNTPPIPCSASTAARVKRSASRLGARFLRAKSRSSSLRQTSINDHRPFTMATSAWSSWGRSSTIQLAPLAANRSRPRLASTLCPAESMRRRRLTRTSRVPLEAISRPFRSTSKTNFAAVAVRASATISAILACPLMCPSQQRTPRSPASANYTAARAEPTSRTKRAIFSSRQ